MRHFAANLAYSLNNVTQPSTTSALQMNRFSTQVNIDRRVFASEQLSNKPLTKTTQAPHQKNQMSENVYRQNVFCH